MSRRSMSSKVGSVAPFAIRSRPRVCAQPSGVAFCQAQSLAAGYLATAINYALGAMNDLKRFVFDGRLEIDNNPVERCIRGIAVTRKNSLWAGSIPSAEAWAIYFTLIESAKLNGVDPMAYLQWAGHEIDRHKCKLDYSTLMPWLCPIGRNRAKPAAA